MSKLGFAVGKITPCLHHHAERHAACYRHCDDLVLLATRETQAWFTTELSKSMLTKHTGTLGPSKLLGDVQEVRILNRILRYVQPPDAGADKAYLEWEPDPRHVEILVSAMGRDSGSKPFTARGAKMPR